MEGKWGEGILAFVGSTPLLELKSIVPAEAARIFVKLESMNPGGSVKDRIALNMIRDAETNELLKPGGMIIEPTSGNTGISLALIGGALGYKVVLVMSEAVGEERVNLLKACGAEIKFTKAALGMQGAIDKAEQIQKKSGDSFMPHQFSNPANPDAHRKTTAKEILKAMGRKSIDAFVAGVGTGGTITGVGEVLRTRYPEVKLVAVEPKQSAVISGGTPGYHRINGIGAGFVPEVLNLNMLSEVVAVDEEKAAATVERLAKEEGVLVGLSSGAAIEASFDVARKLGPGKNIVAILPDGRERI